MDCRHQVQHLNSQKATEDERQAFTLPTIDMYGLDCTADENDENEDIDRCHCPKRLKLSNGKWSQYLESSDDHVCNDAPVDKENPDVSETSDLADNRRKFRSSTRQPYSFSGISEEFREDEAAKIQAIGAKSRSYPLRTRSLNILNKCTQDQDSKTEERDKLHRPDFTSATASTSGKKLTGKWDKYLEVGQVERDTTYENDFSASSSGKKQTGKWTRRLAVDEMARHAMSEDDSLSATACSSDKKFTGKWERYLEVGKVEHDMICEDDFSSISTTCSGQKLSGKREGYSDSETEEQYMTCKNGSPSAATPSVNTTLDEFSEEAKDEWASNSEVEDERDKATTNKSTAARRQSAKCNIFEDYNDDLDLTIDF